MKQIRLMLFALLLSNSVNTLIACSYYPTGEDVRFSLFSQNLGDGIDMEQLFYNAHFFNNYTQQELRGPEENLNEWYSHFAGQFDHASIDELIYKSTYEKPRPSLYQNPLYLYFKEGNEPEVSTYILFAKKVEYYLKESFWEEKTMDVKNARLALEHALEKTKVTGDEMLKLRYAYQAMVLSYYLDDYATGLAVYEKYVEPLKSNSVIAMWCLFHKSNMIDDPYERRRLQAIVFDKSRSKNPYIFQYFPTEMVQVLPILKQCETNAEKAAVYSIMAFKNSARALEELKKIAALNSETELLDILLVREINKMEDWYFTNRYTGYEMALVGWWGDEGKFDFVREKNFESDKLYLREVLAWARELVDKNKVPNKTLWYTSVAYMGYMLDDQKTTENYLDKAEKSEPNKLEMGQLKTIQLLALVKFESDWGLGFQKKLMTYLDEIEGYKEEVYDYDRFRGQIMLAISRKYLEDGNIPLAALFETKVDGGTYEQYTNWWDTHYQGFTLLDVHATSAEMDDFFTLWNKSDKTALEKWLFKGLKPWKWRYTDLWGTTYLREDKLERALEIYETIPDSVWKVDYPELHYYYAQELDANPFATRFTRASFNADRSVHYTKPEFVKELIRIKRNLENNQSKNRAYDYMQLGNAYYNMTMAGNSWYYRSYGLGSYYNESQNNEDFLTGEKALNYYKMAERESKNEGFSAFCYRLQYKCIQLKDQVGAINAYKKRFEQVYPDHYENLRYCDYFEDYFSLWKKA